MKVVILAAALAAFASPLSPALAEMGAVHTAAVAEHTHVRTTLHGTKGQPIVLIPGLSTPGAVWSDMAGTLAADHRVLVVEVSQPLRAQDFDALSATADAWIDANGELPGIVIHAREFPGWENLGSLIRHLRFVRDHHRRVGRVAPARTLTPHRVARPAHPRRPA